MHKWNITTTVKLWHTHPSDFSQSSASSLLSKGVSRHYLCDHELSACNSSALWEGELAVAQCGCQTARLFSIAADHQRSAGHDLRQSSRSDSHLGAPWRVWGSPLWALWLLGCGEEALLVIRQLFFLSLPDLTQYKNWSLRLPLRPWCQVQLEYSCNSIPGHFPYKLVLKNPDRF